MYRESQASYSCCPIAGCHDVMYTRVATMLISYIYVMGQVNNNMQCDVVCWLPACMLVYLH